MENYPLIYIKWLDAVQPVSAWTSFNEIEPCPAECESIGWVITSDSECIVLAGNISYDAEAENMQAAGFIQIPQSAIVHWCYIEAGAKRIGPYTESSEPETEPEPEKIRVKRSGKFYKV